MSTTGHKGRRVRILAMAGAWVVGWAAASGRAEEKGVTFVNELKETVVVHVRVGAGGEGGGCEDKPSQDTFRLDKGEKRTSTAGSVCWCWRRESDGPLIVERDCESWLMAGAGETVHIE